MINKKYWGKSPGVNECKIIVLISKSETMPPKSIVVVSDSLEVLFIMFNPAQVNLNCKMRC